MSSFEIWLTNDAGRRLDLMDENHGFSYTRVVNNIGSFSVNLPATFDRSLLKRDYRVMFYRRPSGVSNLRLEFVGFLRRWGWSTSQAGQTTLVVGGPDLMDLLDRRIVAYDAGTAQAAMSDQADDMMKAIVTDNLAGDATSARDWTDAGLTVQGDSSDGASVVKSFSRRNVLLVLQEISAMAKTAGNEVFFDIVPTSATAFEFQTWLDQRGTDRSWSGSQPVIFGLEYGNLEMPRLEYDYSEEATFVYAGGQGEAESRDTQTAEDTTRSGASLFNRCEVFRDARHCETSAKVQDVADARLAEGEPVQRFDGTLTDNDAIRYGVDWFFGDKVTAVYQGIQVDGVIRSVTVSVDETGHETVEGRLGLD